MKYYVLLIIHQKVSYFEGWERAQITYSVLCNNTVPWTQNIAGMKTSSLNI